MILTSANLMSNPASLDLRAKRIAHIKGHRDKGYNLERLVHNIENDAGDPRACVSRLSSHAEASAMYEWFGENDLEGTRNWFYVAAKLDQKYYRVKLDRINAGAKFFGLLKPLISNFRPLIEWFAHFDAIYDMEAVENHKAHDFWAYQGIVALRGEWKRLAERCKRVLSDPPTGGYERKYLGDHHFYAALADGDVGRMTEAIEKMVEPGQIRSRYDDDSGYAKDLISTAAVVMAKIAWFHGYEVSVASPLIPAEWLPMQPLAHYENRYTFLR